MIKFITWTSTTPGIRPSYTTIKNLIADFKKGGIDLKDKQYAG
jgi:transposase